MHETYPIPRYKILNPAAVAKESDPKKSAGLVLESTGLDPDTYRLGHTKACLHSIFKFLMCSFIRYTVFFHDFGFILNDVTLQTS